VYARIMLPDWVYDTEDHRFMAEALGAAEAAMSRGEVPVGAVVSRNGEIIVRTGNRRAELSDPTGHAELLAIREAGSIVGDWRLSDCTLYVTLEPCPMCAAACRQARLELLIWGADDPRAGACGSVLDIVADPRLGPPLAHRGGLEAERSAELLKHFFAKQRQSS
jgi:tRNA(adenine34) deaminase